MLAKSFPNSWFLPASMSEILFQYHRVHPSSWVYLSSLLMIGLFFKFNRFWSVRNLDLVTLILISPGLLLIQYGSEARRVHDLDVQAVTASIENGNPLPMFVERAISAEHLGYCWCFVLGGFWLFRLLLDPTMVRRPLLEPNLTTGGLAFISCSLYVFLIANVFTDQTSSFELPTALSGVDSSDVGDVKSNARDKIQNGESDARESDARESDAPESDAPESDDPDVDAERSGVISAGLATPKLHDQRPNGPGYSVVKLAIRNMEEKNRAVYVTAAKVVASLSHLAVVLGVVLIGYRQFDNMRAGIGVATLYLMMPYTAITTARMDHVLPAALLVWAVLSYRRPVWAGLFLGLAGGVVYYPFFLLPLWTSFYWRRGLGRFLASFGSIIMLLMVVQLIIARGDWQVFSGSLVDMFGIWLPRYQDLEGIWGLGWRPVYRLPILALFVAMSGTLAIWPAQKNLGTLISCSGAVMLATQFWHGYGGGIFVGWYLPLLLLTIFRPNLEDRFAVTVLGESWWYKRLARDGWFAQPRRRDQGKRDGQARRRDTRRKSESNEVR